MKANHHFGNKDLSFWGNVRKLSEELGYSNKNIVLTHSVEQIAAKMNNLNITSTNDLNEELSAYFDYRADLLNNTVENNLMDVEEAAELFHNLYTNLYPNSDFPFKFSMNKQKGDKRNEAYFTAIIDILTTNTLAKINPELSYNHDPRKLTYITDNTGKLTATMSRRFDGAFPDIVNPQIVWEIKEYYYTTTFGSRISDGVYETLLDGHEINEFESFTDKNINHAFLIDSHRTWWNSGKSYLCRIIDALNMHLVDEVICGKEVVTRWPALLIEIIGSQSAS